jgi:hypothetical protein
MSRFSLSGNRLFSMTNFENRYNNRYNALWKLETKPYYEDLILSLGFCFFDNFKARFFGIIQDTGNPLHSRGKSFEIIISRSRALMPEHLLNFSKSRFA